MKFRFRQKVFGHFFNIGTVFERDQGKTKKKT